MIIEYLNPNELDVNEMTFNGECVFLPTEGIFQQGFNDKNGNLGVFIEGFKEETSDGKKCVYISNIKINKKLLKTNWFELLLSAFCKNILNLEKGEIARDNDGKYKYDNEGFLVPIYLFEEVRMTISTKPSKEPLFENLKYNFEYDENNCLYTYRKWRKQM